MKKSEESSYAVIANCKIEKQYLFKNERLLNSHKIMNAIEKVCSFENIELEDEEELDDYIEFIGSNNVLLCSNDGLISRYDRKLLNKQHFLIIPRKDEADINFTYHYLKNYQEKIFSFYSSNQELEIFQDKLGTLEFLPISIERQREIAENCVKYDEQIQYYLKQFEKNRQELENSYIDLQNKMKNYKIKKK